MLQAIIALYFLTVLVGGALVTIRAVRRHLPLISAALAYQPSVSARRVTPLITARL